MLKLAVLIFAIGAVGGLILASSVLRDRLPSWGLSILHAALGAAGLVLTAIVVLGSGSADVAKVVPVALLVLVVAALGGFFLASFHARKASPPNAVVIVHAGVAVIGFLLLLGGVFHFI
jgi:FtsH-binding integral membrane protein